MNRDDEIAHSMLLGHFGLALVALGGAFDGIYVAMSSASSSIGSSLAITATLVEYLAFSSVVMIIGGIIFAHYAQKLNKLRNNS